MPVSERCASHSAIHFEPNSVLGSGSGRNEAENALTLPAETVPAMRSAGISHMGRSTPAACAVSGNSSSSTAGLGQSPRASRAFFSFSARRLALMYSAMPEDSDTDMRLPPVDHRSGSGAKRAFAHFKKERRETSSPPRTGSGNGLGSCARVSRVRCFRQTRGWRPQICACTGGRDSISCCSARRRRACRSRCSEWKRSSAKERRARPRASRRTP